jgi:hypothetical protein
MTTRDVLLGKGSTFLPSISKGTIEKCKQNNVNILCTLSKLHASKWKVATKPIIQLCSIFNVFG